MSPQHQMPAWLSKLLVGFVVVFALRVAFALSTGIGTSVVIRTYFFWALVCAPVAYLADILVRTVSEYRLVRLTLARVRSRR